MDLPISEEYLLLTEKITNRPMLRTRFTAQAYLVLATFLDLRDQHLLTVTDQRVAIPNEARLRAALPANLQVLVDRLTQELASGTATDQVFHLLVSWDLANAIYDSIGPDLVAQHRAERVVFQNNLLPHDIYEPTVVARQTLLDQLTREITTRTVTQQHLGLLVIFTQLNALKWLLPNDVAHQAQAILPTLRDYTELQSLASLAQHRITLRKFELDSWLS